MALTVPSRAVPLRSTKACDASSEGVWCGGFMFTSFPTHRRYVRGRAASGPPEGHRRAGELSVQRLLADPAVMSERLPRIRHRPHRSFRLLPAALDPGARLAARTRPRQPEAIRGGVPHDFHCHACTPGQWSVGNDKMTTWHRTPHGGLGLRQVRARRPHIRPGANHRGGTRRWPPDSSLDRPGHQPLIPSRTETAILRDMGEESAVAAPELDEAIDLAARLAAAAEEGRVDLSDLGRRARRLLAATTSSSSSSGDLDSPPLR